jgi:hypothetical protein
MMHVFIPNETPLEIRRNVRAVDRVKRDATLVEVSQELTYARIVCGE